MAKDREINGTIGHYRLLGRLGAGSTGTIHAAEDVETGESVAIKLANSVESGDGGPSSAEALQREATLLSRLHHPNIVRLKANAASEGVAYLVLEQLEGMDLETSLLAADRPLDETALLALLLRLTEALTYMHSADILHRDLKPGNIGLRRSGEPVIVDFGAAVASDLPQAGAGQWSEVTAGYGAPEQYLEDGAEGPWTDIYGLGAIAYRAIAGVAPPAAPARRAGETMPPAVEAGKGRCSANLLRAVDWALELDPKARPQSASAWSRSLKDSTVETAMPDDQHRPVPEERVPDPYPPTERVERVPGQRPVAAVQAPIAAPEVSTAGRAGPGPWLWLVLVAFWACVGLGGWFGWPYYQRYFETTWIVDASGGGDTLTIGEALSRAADDAMVLVRPGTYAESLTLDRPVHLKAADPDAEAPLVVPPEGPCMVIRAASGSVAGLHLRIGEATETVPPPAVPCIDIAASGMLVAGNQIESTSGPAIRLRDGAAPEIRENTITGAAGPGILVSAGARGLILDNTIQGVGGSGIVARGGATPEIIGNVIEDSGAAGVLFSEAAGGRLENNIIRASAASGIEVGANADPIVRRNRIEAAGQAGIFVYDLGRGRFRDNEVVSSGFSGLVISAGGAPDFVDNLIRDSAEHGILAIGRVGGVIGGNTVRDNQGHGIALARNTDIELGENVLENNKEPQVMDDWLAGF